MIHQTKLIFLILFVLREFLPKSKYDISVSLPDWIDKIFKNAEDRMLDIAVKEPFSSSRWYTAQTLEYDITDQGFPSPFQSKIIFFDTKFHLTDEDRKETKSTPFTLETWNLSDSKIRISTKKFRVTLEGQIRVKKDQRYAKYWTTLQFEDFVLDAIRVSKDPKNVKYSFKFSYKSLRIHDMYKWSGNYIGWQKGYITVNKGIQLARSMEPMLPLVLHDYMNRDPMFSEYFGKITKIYDHLFETTSATGNLQDHRQQYYYLIPRTPYYGFYLRNVMIKGLLNIESLNVDKKSPLFTRTLLMKNIRGNMTLDYGSKDRVPLDLNFVIDYLTISLTNGTDIVHLEARSYGVNRTTGASLTHRQSAKIIQKIECALAAELMPSKRAWKTCNMESDIDQIEITNTTDWKIIEQKYGDWIPFNHDAPKKSGLVRRILGGRFMSNR